MNIEKNKKKNFFLLIKSSKKGQIQKNRYRNPMIKKWIPIKVFRENSRKIAFRENSQKKVLIRN